MIEAGEQRQVLDMLEAGTIEAADAERLLAGLDEAACEAVPQTPRSAGERARHLVVFGRNEDHEISARVPLKLIATGMAFEKLLPEAAREMVEDMGIDLAELRNVRGDQLIEALQDLEVDLDDPDGNHISIRCE